MSLLSKRVDRVARLLTPTEWAVLLREEMQASGSVDAFLAALPAMTWPTVSDMARSYAVDGAGLDRSMSNLAESAAIEYETARNALRMVWTLSLDRGVRLEIERRFGGKDQAQASPRSRLIASAVLRVAGHEATFEARVRRDGWTQAREWYQGTVETDPVYGLTEGAEWVLPESERMRILFLCFGPVPAEDRKGAVVFKWEG